MRGALFRFAASSAVLLLVLMMAVLVVANRIATGEALRDARMRGSNIANLMAGPLVNADVRNRVPGTSDELTRVMRNRMGDGSVVHVKIWSQDGVVLWSDESELVGRRFTLTKEVKALFGTEGVTSKVSDLSEADNGGERRSVELLEVYAGARDADQVPMVFEAYFSAESMRRDEQAIIYGLSPVIIGALLLFQVAVLPMAMSLARRVERGLAERSRWMKHALLASDLERRRIAQDLHDGVIQDLAGVCYAMPGLEAELAGSSATPAAQATSRRVSQILKRDVTALRSMITDIYPPDLEGPGLVAAVQDLGRGAGESGLKVQVDVAPGLSAPVDVARLAYRVVREGLRNVAKHAQATAVKVEIQEYLESIVVSVSDNGRGVPDGQVTAGHLGLRLLEDTVRDFGGQMTLRSASGGGTVLEASFPITLVTS